MIDIHIRPTSEWRKSRRQSSKRKLITKNISKRNGYQPGGENSWGEFWGWVYSSRYKWCATTKGYGQQHNHIIELNEGRGQGDHPPHEMSLAWLLLHNLPHLSCTTHLYNRLQNSFQWRLHNMFWEQINGCSLFPASREGTLYSKSTSILLALINNLSFLITIMCYVGSRSSNLAKDKFDRLLGLVFSAWLLT